MPLHGMHIRKEKPLPEGAIYQLMVIQKPYFSDCRNDNIDFLGTQDFKEEIFVTKN